MGGRKDEPVFEEAKVVETAGRHGWVLTPQTITGRYESESKLMFQRQVWTRNFTGCNRRIYHTAYCAVCDMPAGKQGRISQLIEWDEEHLDEKCNARKCTMWNHRSWGLRKQKQVFSVWLTTGTTRSDLKHPKTNRNTPLFRRPEIPGRSEEERYAALDKILQNPREHTGVGYHFKK